jgi:hypothetical protein
VKTIQLTDSEQAVLLDLLDRAYRDLKEEIYKTETFAFKLGLRRRAALIERLLDELTPSSRPRRAHG